MNQESRINYIIEMYKKINPTDVINKYTTIKNTSIEKLCEFNGGAYNRIREWMESKIFELQTPIIKDDDIIKFKEEMNKCFELFKSRNKKYGSSWKALTMSSIANLIEMKMNRIANMDIEKLNPKIEDEFIDACNYAIMGLMKLNNNKKYEKSTST